jgi:hypothetical protein
MFPSARADSNYVGVSVGDSWTYSMSADFQVEVNFTDTSGTVVVEVLSISGEGDIGDGYWGRNVSISWTSTVEFIGIGLNFTYQEFIMPIFENRDLYNNIEDLMDGPLLLINDDAQKSHTFSEDGYTNKIDFDYFGVLVKMDLWINDDDMNKVHLIVERDDVGGTPDYLGVTVGDTWTFEMEVDYDDSSIYSDETIELILTVSQIGQDLGSHCLIIMEWAFTPNPLGLNMEGDNIEQPVFSDVNTYDNMQGLFDGPLVVINVNADKSYSWTQDGHDMSLTYDENGVVETMDFWVNAEDDTLAHLTVSKTSSFHIPGYSFAPFAVLSLLAIAALLKRKH